MNHYPYARILALEVRYRRMGFAVLEWKPMRLLDSGTRTYISAAAIPQRLEPLISMFDPCVIVVRRPGHKNLLHLNGVKSNLRVIQTEAARRSIPMESVTVHEVRCAFHESGTTKESIAATIAQTFSELQLKLPPKRKPWTSEGHNMVVFDATATGLAYLARSDVKENPP
jgi:hypothetical protein